MKNKNILITFLIILLLTIICCICSVLISFLVYKNSNSISYSRTIWQGDNYAEFFSSNGSKKLVDPALYTLIKCYDRNHKQFASYNPDSNDYMRFALDNDSNYANSFNVKSCKPITDKINPKFNKMSSSSSKIGIMKTADQVAIDIVKKSFPSFENYGIEGKFFAGSTVFVQTNLLDSNIKYVGMALNGSGVLFVEPITCFEVNLNNQSAKKIGSYKTTDSDDSKFISDLTLNFSYYSSFANVFDLATCKMK